jgi:hypothetical protein
LVAFDAADSEIISYGFGVGLSEHGSPAGLASINTFGVEFPDSISNAGMP